MYKRRSGKALGIGEIWEAGEFMPFVNALRNTKLTSRA